MIDHYSFGSMTISGKPYSSDLKIINGKVISEWWRNTGHHVDIADVGDIFDAEPDIFVIGSGSSGLMKVGDRVIERCEADGIQLIVESTSVAVETFNRLYADEKNVAGGFHLTC